ncbi:MAG: hypothetical protein ABF289_17005 [Clostridiales bacterium]
MNNIKIEIESDYNKDEYSDEMEELTRVLKSKIEENDEVSIEEVKIPTKLGEKDSKGLEIMEVGKLLVDVLVNPEVVATLILILSSWIKNENETNSIAKSISLDYKNKKYKLTGYSGDDAEKIIKAIKGEE